jgi:choline dehydrogenase-like flavoprotein
MSKDYTLKMWLSTTISSSEVCILWRRFFVCALTIIGGTAGCVLANRLSANPSVSVLLLERGERNDGIIAGSAILSLPPVGVLPAKAIAIAPQKHLSPRNQDVYESLCLGGRTRINAGLFLQGCPAEYENWGKGWQWEDVAPFFERLEGRLELEKRNNQPQSHTVEGRECKTRVMKAKYESSRQ